MGIIHTKIMADSDATVYRRVDEYVVEDSVDAGDDLAYIIVDHLTRKVVCGPTEERARQNLHRLRGASPFRDD